jgi:hypothetical protein
VYNSDGSIEFVEGTTINSRWRRFDGISQDTIFEDESDSPDDAVLGFTLEMDDYGPIYVWD